MEENRTCPRDNETHPPIKAKYSIIVDKSKIKTIWLRLSLSDFHFRILYLNPIDNRLNGALRNNIES